MSLKKVLAVPSGCNPKITDLLPRLTVINDFVSIEENETILNWINRQITRSLYSDKFVNIQHLNDQQANFLVKHRLNQGEIPRLRLLTRYREDQNPNLARCRLLMTHSDVSTLMEDENLSELRTPVMRIIDEVVDRSGGNKNRCLFNLQIFADIIPPGKGFKGISAHVDNENFGLPFNFEHTAILPLISYGALRAWPEEFTTVENPDPTHAITVNHIARRAEFNDGLRHDVEAIEPSKEATRVRAFIIVNAHIYDSSKSYTSAMLNNYLTAAFNSGFSPSDAHYYKADTLKRFVKQNLCCK